MQFEAKANEEWLKEYEQQQAEKKKQLEGLTDRVSGKESLSNW